MTAEQFSAEFDQLYNNITSNKAPGLDEYEKSVFLTQAQELVVKDLYSGNTGPYEITEEVTEYLNSITKQKVFDLPTDVPNDDALGLFTHEYQIPQYDWSDSDSSDSTEHEPISYESPIWYIIYEQAFIEGDEDCDKGSRALVIPTKHNDLYKAADNPFRKPDRFNVLRVLYNNNIELYSNEPISKYLMRYVEEPAKIVLYSDGISSQGYPEGWNIAQATCKLPSSLHRVILLKAVQLAKAVWQ